MRDVLAGFASMLGFGLLLAGGFAWLTRPIPNEVGRLDTFFYLFGAGACFFCGGWLLISRRERDAGPARDASSRARCPTCTGDPASVCTLCNSPYCERHGGRRWVWFPDSGEDGGYSFARRDICEGCTPSAARLRWALALVGLFFVAVVAGLIYGWRNFPIGH